MVSHLSAPVVIVVSLVLVSGFEDTFLAKYSRHTTTLLVHACYLFWPDLSLALVTNNYSGLPIFTKRADRLELLLV